MMPKEIKKGIYWVGAIDWNVRDFHGYNTSNGTSYNAFLIIDKKNVLIDTVKPTHTAEMLDRIKKIIDPSKIDIVVSNHVEMDHSGGLPELLKIAPNATLITSTNGEKGLKEHYDTSTWNMQVMKSGESVNIGKRNIQFIHTPMVHWPDSMFTYVPEDKLLLPNDAFGQHMASEYLFNDENPSDIVMAEATKYYANIVYPFGAQVKKALDLVADLEIDMIAPSHGVIWRTDIEKIVSAYSKWAGHSSSTKALIIYDSMWGATEKIAKSIKSTFEDNNIPVIQRCLKTSHISDIMTDILESKFIAIGSPVLNSQILPSAGGLLTYIKGLRPKNKIGISFGSYGWSHAGINEIESVMSGLKWALPVPSINIKYQPNENDFKMISENINTVIKEFHNDK